MSNVRGYFLATAGTLCLNGIIKSLKLYTWRCLNWNKHWHNMVFQFDWMNVPFAVFVECQVFIQVFCVTDLSIDWTSARNHSHLREINACYHIEILKRLLLTQIFSPVVEIIRSIKMTGIVQDSFMLTVVFCWCSCSCMCVLHVDR